MIRKAKKSLSVLLALVTMITALTFCVNVGSVQADAAGWNGTNYGGGSVAGYRTFLEAFGIDYDTYIKWMDDHDDDSPNPDYYLGTRYVGYDHRNPHGDCGGAYGSLDTPGVEALNCTGFVWHVLYKAAYHSGASRAQINRLPIMGNVTPTWASLGVYRIYFPTKEAALASGVLEKGDLLWIYGTKDNHNAIFYGENSHHDLFWHSAGPNSLGRIDAPGDFRGMWVAKVTQPNKIELRVNAKTPYNNNGGFGAKYCVFDSAEKAEAAKRNPGNSTVWDSRIGTIALDASGCGTLRTESAPSQSELWKNDVPQTGLSYFSSAAKKVDASKTYYAVQWSPAKGMEADTEIRTFTDSGKRTSTGYRIFNFKLPKKVTTPVISKLKSTAYGVKISWNAVSGAERYRVYYKNSSGGWTRLGETSSTSMLDDDVSAGHTYTYTVRCVDNDGDFTSNYNTLGWSHTYAGVAAPQITSLNGDENGVHIKWNPVNGATRYRVYYQNSSGGWNRMGETSSTEFLDDIVTAGNTYTYTVRCVNSSGSFISDYNRSGWSYTYKGVATPIISRLDSEDNGIRLSWNPVAGAAKYRLYYKNAAGGWNTLGETAETEFLDDVVTAGNSYTYTIRCLNSRGRLISSYIASGWTGKYDGVAAPQITKLESTASGVKISWEPVEGAKHYRVFYMGRNGWVRLGNTDSTEYLDTDVRSGGTYTYTVRCFGDHNNYTSSFNAQGSTIKYQK